jgi:outer membrane protein OmpA-like peptidoglycan-associated protein
VVLKPLQTSVIPELDRSCNAIIPAEGYADPPHHRGTGPAEGQQRERPPPEIPQPPYAVQAFDVKFDFDLDHPWVIADRAIEAAMLYAQASHAASIEVIGYRGYSDLTDGVRLNEPDDLPQRRAVKVSDSLQQIGVSKSIIRVTWKHAPDGGKPADRHVVIRVFPGSNPK